MGSNHFPMTIRLSRALNMPKTVLVGALWAVGWGLSGGALALDFQQAYDAALANDAQIKASRAMALAEGEQIPQARAQLLPNVSLSAGRTYNDLTSQTRNFLGQQSKDNNSYYSGNQLLTVRQPLYRPYLLAQQRQARSRVVDANAILDRDEHLLTTRVGEAYFNALLAQDQLKLLDSQKTMYNAQLDAARKALAAGSGTRTDIDEAQAQLDMTAAQELEALQNVDFTRRRLETLTGIPVNRLATLDTARFVPTAPVPDSLDAWTALAEEASPELRSLRAQLESAQQEIEKAQSGHKPTLDAVAQWSRSNSDSVTSVNSRYDNKTIGLQLTVPIYGGGYVSSTVRQAVIAKDRVTEMLEATRRDLGVRVHTEFRGMTEGVMRVKALQQAVVSAEQALESNKRSFTAGSRTMLDVLNSEQKRTLAYRDLAQARYLYLLSQVRLQGLVGADRQTSVAHINAWLQP